jgi:hypothetical protein
MYMQLIHPPVPEYCLAGAITNDHAARFDLATGTPTRSRYPADELDVQVHFDPDHRGLQLPTILSNYSGLLMLEHHAAKQLLAELELGPTEQFRFTLINHKGRTCAPQYVFLNPIGDHDIAHPSSAFLRFETSGNIYDCDRWVLDHRKLAGLPDLVRARSLPRAYFVSSRFVDYVQANKLSNFHFEAVEHI